MDHSYFKDRISGYYDNNLPPYEQQSVEDHLKTCEECQGMLLQFEKLDQLVEEKSQLSDTEYWEKSALKIEKAIGVESNEKIIDVTEKSNKSLFWKISAVAASVAVLTFIGLNQTDISSEAEMKLTQPSEIQVEKKLEVEHEKSIADETKELADDEKDAIVLEPTDDVLEKEKSAKKIEFDIDTVVKKNEIEKDVTEKQPSKITKASKPMAVSNQSGDVQIKDKSKFESGSVLSEETAIQPQSAPVIITGTAESVQQFFAEGLAPSDKVNLDNLRIKRDSLKIIYSSCSQVDNIKLKAGRSKSIALSDILDDSVKAQIEKELLDTYYEIGLHSKNETEKSETIRFFENYINRKESNHIDLAREYLDLLK